MHLTLPIVLSLLSATTLALPTTTTTLNPTKTLDKRAKNPWIGAFSNAQCTGPVAPGDITASNHVTGQCYKWSPVKGTSYIGINYGSEWDQVTEVTFFTDVNCKNVNGAASYVWQGSDLKGMGCTGANETTKSFMLGGSNS